MYIVGPLAIALLESTEYYLIHICCCINVNYSALQKNPFFCISLDKMALFRIEKNLLTLFHMGSARYVITWGGGGHFVPASTLSLYNAANMPPSHQNLISNKNFGLYLSIDTKNSPLNSVLLPQSVAESRTSPLKNFQAKKSRNFKF